MKGLLGNAFAPLTFEVGFLEASFDKVHEATLEWRRGQFFATVEATEVKGPLSELLRGLEPFCKLGRRDLILETRSHWTARFDSAADATSWTGHLASVLGCRGVLVRCAPDTNLMYGGVKLDLLGPERREWLNYVRSICASKDGDRWRFDAVGEVQPFEQIEKYKTRKIADRFTPDMLEQYCAAFGIALFDGTFYGPRGALIVCRPPENEVGITLAELRRRAGLE
ncbi:MAG: hypothetical protein NTW87_14005 [Planctomycetota bacterium]|nr:hypothetical protein [Planctomycetota bacterium]